MKYLPESGWRRVLVLSAYILIGIAAAYAALRYLLAAVLPFFIAWVTAMALRPAIDGICRRTKLKRRAVSFFCVLFVLLTFTGLLAVIVGRTAEELRGLADNLMTDAADAVGDIFDYFEDLRGRFPFLDGLEDRATAERVESAILSAVENSVSAFTAKIPEAVMGIVSSLPGLILSFVVLVTATFYMCADVAGINSFIAGLFPPGKREKLFAAKKRSAADAGRYIRAYLLILFITFAQLLTGFLILKIPYALTLAAVIALIDILPVLGVGTVLIPWAGILLIRGQTYTGVGILLLFAIIWLARQIIEPKIVGHSMGVHPLITLAAMYAGFTMLGVSGLFIFPIAAMLIKNAVSALREEQR